MADNVVNFPSGDRGAEGEAGQPTLQTGGGGGTFGDMEARLKSLETRADRIDSKLETLIRDVSEIKGRIANMPSTWQMIAICGTMIGLVLASGAAVLSIIRMVAPGAP